MAEVAPPDAGAPPPAAEEPAADAPMQEAAEAPAEVQGEPPAEVNAGPAAREPEAEAKAEPEAEPAKGGAAAVSSKQPASAAALGAIPEGFKILVEGRARILQKGNDVFYNEAQVTNRDLSILVLRRFLAQREAELASGQLRRPNAKRPQHKAAPGKPPKGQEKVKGARLLEGLAASGLRSIRYALEVPGLGRIDANDMDAAVVEAMGRNIELNGPEAQARVHTSCADARLVMMQNPQTYDAVDLDPYGTPAPLLDTALQTVTDGGLLLVTATDMANLCGNNGVACFSNYGSYPVHRPYCHEMALRIVLGCLETHANRYRRHIVPLLSLSVDFYVRVFVRVYTSPAACKDTPCRLAYLWQSSGCDSFWLQRIGQKKVQGKSEKWMPGTGPAVPDMRCPDTGSGYLMGGPLWAEPIHEFDFVRGLLSDVEAADPKQFAAAPRIRGLLLSVASELPHAPLYYDLHDVCKTVKVTPPKSEVFRAALINAGYKVSGSHANPLALKTDAPPSVVWDIVRCYVRLHPAPSATKDPESYSAKLLAKQPVLEANFKMVAGAMMRKKDDKTPRFVQNPAYWGPKARHGRPDATRPDNSDGAAGPSGHQHQRNSSGGGGGGNRNGGNDNGRNNNGGNNNGGGKRNRNKNRNKQRHQQGGQGAAGQEADLPEGGPGTAAEADQPVEVAAGQGPAVQEPAGSGAPAAAEAGGAAAAADAGGGDADGGEGPAAKRART